MNSLAYFYLMHLFSALFAFYVRASFHVSVALLALLAYTQLLFGLMLPPAFYGALFFASVAGYNGIKYGVEPWKHVPGKGRDQQLIFGVSVICLGMSFYSLATLAPLYWLLFGGCSLLAALYALPLLPGMRNLRSYAGLKVPVVALVWTALSVLIPVYAVERGLGWDHWVEAFQRFLWVFLLMIPFEIRDLRYDPPGLLTLPRRWGLKGVRRMGWAAAILFVAATWFKDHLPQAEILSKSLVGILLVLGIRFSRENQSETYASFWVESIPIAGYLLLRLFAGHTA